MPPESKRSPRSLEMPPRATPEFCDQIEDFANATAGGVSYQVIRQLNAAGELVAARMEVVDRERLLARHRVELEELQRRRAELQREIGEVDQRIARLRGTPSPPSAAPSSGRDTVTWVSQNPTAWAPAETSAGPRTSGRGPRGEGENLHDYLRRILATATRPMRVPELAEAVLTAGYVSSSKKFGAVIVQRLANMSGVRRAGRGLYELDPEA